LKKEGQGQKRNNIPTNSGTARITQKERHHFKLDAKSKDVSPKERHQFKLDVQM
jgi:hypothetical protein